MINMNKLKGTRLLAKTNTISSYLWLASVIAFVSVILISTKGFTKDPCYSPGCAEQGWLLPMLGSLFLGCAFFGLTLVSGLLRKIIKGQNWSAPLGMGAGKTGLVTIVAILIFVVYFIGSMNNGVRFGGSYTGEELLNAVNRHRESVNIPALKLGEGLCDNLVSRWKAVKEGKQHEGFEEWVTTEGIQSNYGYGQIAELYISAATPADAVAFWVGSPGHKTQLENSQWTEGCSYASEGHGVVVMSSKQIQK